MQHGPNLSPRSPGRAYITGNDSSRQESAVLDARLARLRKALNLWWDRTDEGTTSGDPADGVSVRQLLEDAAEQLARMKRLRR